MTTLDEHNAERMRIYDRQRIPGKNGIDCPECGGDLMDTDPNVTLTSLPPKKNIHCTKCDYKGYRVA